MVTATGTDPRSATRPAAGPKPYRPGFKLPFDLDVSDIKPTHLKMLLVFEILCGQKSYCWPSNKTLADRCGCSVSQVKVILDQMQHEGYLWRLAVEPDRFRTGSGRAGIFLHKRLNPDLPVEDRPPPPEAIARLWASRNASRPPAGFPAAPPAGFPAAPPAGFPAASNKALSLNGDQGERLDADPDQRQRPDQPDPPHEPGCPGPVVTETAEVTMDSPAPLPPAAAPVEAPALVEDPPAAAPAAAELPELAAAAALGDDQAGDLAAGQREFLATLADAQRSTFDALPADKRAEVLRPTPRDMTPSSVGNGPAS